MTYEELRQEVFDLGFDDDIEPHALLTATNRVLMQLWRYEPRKSRVVLTVREPLLCELREQAVSTSLRFAQEGIAAVSFESIGRGLVETVKVGESTYETIASTTWQRRVYLFSAEQKNELILSGIERFFVRNIAVFGAFDSTENLKTIPFLQGDWICYDLSAYFDDGFIALDNVPVTEHGVPVYDFRLEGDTLLLPAQVRGHVMVEARRRLKLATLDNFVSAGYVTAVPDCPERLMDLLPLGVAAYVWADLEPEKAAYCKQRFDEGLAMDRLMQDHGGSQTVIRRKRW